MRGIALIAVVVMLLGCSPHYVHRTMPRDTPVQLDQARDLASLSRLVGTTPQCSELGDMAVCSWEVTNRMPGYKILKPLAGTRGRVFLVCELPVDGSGRAYGSCTVSGR